MAVAFKDSVGVVSIKDAIQVVTVIRAQCGDTAGIIAEAQMIRALRLGGSVQEREFRTLCGEAFRDQACSKAKAPK